MTALTVGAATTGLCRSRHRTRFRVGSRSVSSRISTAIAPMTCGLARDVVGHEDSAEHREVDLPKKACFENMTDMHTAEHARRDERHKDDVSPRAL